MAGAGLPTGNDSVVELGGGTGDSESERGESEWPPGIGVGAPVCRLGLHLSNPSLLQI